MAGCTALSLLYLLFAAAMSEIPLQLSIFTGLIPFQERYQLWWGYFHLHAAHVRFNNLLLSLSPILLHLEMRWSRWEEGVGPSLCLIPRKTPVWDCELWLAALDGPRVGREDLMMTWRLSQPCTKSWYATYLSVLPWPFLPIFLPWLWNKWISVGLSCKALRSLTEVHSLKYSG